VGTDSRAVKNSPSQLTSIIWRKASVSISSTDPSRARPALATTVSRRLNSAAAASTRSATLRLVVGDVCGVDEDVDPVLLTQRVGQRLESLLAARRDGYVVGAAAGECVQWRDRFPNLPR